jgi:hypothetical protein
MFKHKLFIKSFFLCLLFFISLGTNAQSGIFFQAIAKDINKNPATDRKIYVQTNIIQATPTGTIILSEEHQTSTDAYGVFSIMVGNGTRVGGSLSGLSDIDWSDGPYYLNLKIAITPLGLSGAWDYTKAWVDLGNTIFGTVPIALYAVNTAKMVEKLNIVDTAKMLSVYAKAQALQSLSTIVDTKLAMKDTAAMLRFYTKSYYTDSALRTKLNISDSIQFTKQSYSDSALLTKMNLYDTSVYAKQINVEAALSKKLNNTDTIYYTKKTYVDSALLTIPSLTSLTSLNTVGTIISGVWSATVLDIEHGGTGLTTAGLTGQALTTSAAGTLTWTNISTSGVHYIGESYGGGIVFYVYDNGKHGLIAATSDQILNTRWYGGSYTNTRARADGVGAGLKNTSIIIAVQSGTYTPVYDGASFAATVCNEYTVTIDGVTYGDWYLPSKHELNLLFLQRAVVGNFPNISGSYWSSTEYFRSDLVGSFQLAWYQNFVTGAQAYLNKKNTFSVRAIRAF